MGSSHSRRRNSNIQHNHPDFSSPHPPLSQPAPSEANADRLVYASPYPPPSPNPNPPQFYPYVRYYQPSHAPLPAPYDQYHRGPPHAVPYPCAMVPPAPSHHVEHQKAVTIRNDVNLKKETLRVEPDEENPGQYLVAFTFDAMVAGSITVIFFAKEGDNSNLKSMKESLKPVSVTFKQGLGQKFRQPMGTGIEFASFDELELQKGDMEVYPLAVKAEAYSSTDNGSDSRTTRSGILNAQITLSVFEKKDSGEFQVRVVKQILWVNGMRYELQEIYGIGNSVDNEADLNDPGKECVVCLSEPRDTAVLPCRHMCMCSGCAEVLRHQTNRCPICRQPVERLLEIDVNNKLDKSVDQASCTV